MDKKKRITFYLTDGMSPKGLFEPCDSMPYKKLRMKSEIFNHGF